LKDKTIIVVLVFLGIVLPVIGGCAGAPTQRPAGGPLTGPDPALEWPEFSWLVWWVATLAAVQAELRAELYVNARDEGGRTALTYAALNSTNPDVIHLLLDAGANVHEESIDGKTAWDAIQDNAALQRTDAYWRLHDMRFE